MANNIKSIMISAIADKKIPFEKVLAAIRTPPFNPNQKIEVIFDSPNGELHYRIDVQEPNPELLKLFIGDDK